MSRVRSTHRCIVCDKAIAKRVSEIWFHRTQGTESRTDGDRKQGGHLTEIWLDQRPTTGEEAQRYSNQPILKVRRHNGEISSASFWDGESYVDQYFCKGACAIKQGYASAQHGARFTWSK